MTIGVYMIEHVATGRRYVGKSINVRSRIRDHFAGNGSAVSHIRNAVLKYGHAAFTWTLIEDCADDATARTREVLWIRELGTRAPSGFNLTGGGDGRAGLRHTAETKAKMSATLRGNARFAGHTHTNETRAKIAAANVGKTNSHETCMRIAAGNRGKVISADTRAKTSATLAGRVPARNSRPVSPETRARIAEAGRGRKHSEETLEKMRQAWARRKGAASAESSLSDN